MRVAFAGQPGAYSEAAAAAIFPFDIATQPCPTINSVFDTLMAGEVNRAVVPVEKSSSGYIFETFNRLRMHRLYIDGCVVLRTNFVLAGARGAKEAGVKRIHAHPHALTACEQYLRGKPGVELVPHFDLAEAEAKVSSRPDPAEAVLCSRFSALRRGLTVIREKCDNDEDATSRYVSLGIEPIAPSKDEKGQSLTTVLFEIEDKPGALMRRLAVFAELGLNLVRLKMFPGGEEGSTAVFLTFTGRYTDVAAGRALEVIKEGSQTARHLGSYIIRDLRNLI